MDKEFDDALTARVEKIRPGMVLDDGMYFKGMRFKSNETVVHLITQAIAEKENPEAKEGVLISQDMMGLTFSVFQIETGQYDSFIRTTLKQMASMDYEAENSLDLN